MAVGVILAASFGLASRQEREKDGIWAKKIILQHPDYRVNTRLLKYGNTTTLPGPDKSIQNSGPRKTIPVTGFYIAQGFCPSARGIHEIYRPGIGS